MRETTATQGLPELLLHYIDIVTKEITKEITKMLQSPAAQVGEGERKEKGTGESKKAPDYN